MPVQSLARHRCAAQRLRSPPRASAARARCSCSASPLALTAVAAYEMYLVLAVGGLTGAGSRHPGAVRDPVRLDRAVVREHCSAVSSRLSTAAHRRARHRRRRAAAGDRDPHRAADADLQRGPGIASSRACRRSTSRVAATGHGRPLRRVHPQRHDAIPTSASPRKRRFLRAARAAGRRRASSTATARATTRKKAGNIAEWVQRCGGAYDHMIVLDADSLMTGDTLVRLAAAMERHPERRPDPDAAHAWSTPRHAVRAPAAVRRPPLRPADRARACLVARRGRQLLGPQRHHPHPRLRRQCAGLPALARAASRSAGTSSATTSSRRR